VEQLQLPIECTPSTEDIVGVIDRLQYDELVYIHRMTGLRLLIAAHSARTPLSTDKLSQ